MSEAKTKSIDPDLVKLECQKYYPNEVLFQLDIPRELLKKNLGLKQLHKIIQEQNDSGLLTRQEIVSMLPPLLLDIHHDHAVFDMCAAPGSKTAQVSEMIMASHL